MTFHRQVLQVEAVWQWYIIRQLQQAIVYRTLDVMIISDEICMSLTSYREFT